MNNIIILAAGKGSRMHSDLPKCAISLLDKPMIEYLIETCLEVSDIDNIYCVVGYKKEILLDILSKYPSIKIIEQPNQYGTGDAIKCCLNQLDVKGYSIILPGDTPLISKEDIEQLAIKNSDNLDSEITIGTTLVSNPKGYGRIIRNKFHSIVNIVEESNTDVVNKNIKEVNTAIYCIRNYSLLHYIPLLQPNDKTNEYYLTDIIKLMNDKASFKIDNIMLDSTFCLGVNNLYDLSEMENNYKNILIKELSLQGVRFMNPSTTYISADMKISPGVIIEGNTILKHSTISKDTLIRLGSVVEDSIIGENCTVGPSAHVHSSLVSENCRIGNFVELKKANLGKRNKVAHLAYIGDTTSGDNVNWGCGSVTCNYDGVHKHQTIIGNNVFIGSNCNLIAPIQINDNCFIAAGSTITKDLDVNTFAIARTKETLKKNK